MNQFRRVLLQYIFFADALFIYMAKIGLTYSIFITLFVLVYLHQSDSYFQLGQEKGVSLNPWLKNQNGRRLYLFEFIPLYTTEFCTFVHLSCITMIRLQVYLFPSILTHQFIHEFGTYLNPIFHLRIKHLLQNYWKE